MNDQIIIEQLNLENSNPKLAELINKYYLPINCTCTFCGKSFHRYKVHGYESELAYKHNLTCMGYRRAKCPYCGSKDKERWLWYVLENYTDITTTNGRVMHFAPEGPIKSRITNNTECKYYSGDIQPGVADLIVDMTDMQFEDSFFDCIIASMVMEHIPEEEKALKELFRTCKDGGKIVLTVPQCTDIEETIEDLSITDSKVRTQLYGQDDHVRLYGLDYPQRFYNMAFNGCDIQFIRPMDLFGEEQISSMGIQKEYGVFVCTVKK